MTNNEIRGMTPTLKFIGDLLSLFQQETITIPAKYRDKVLVVKNLLNDDPSGIINTILDFSIECALVNYRIEVEGNDELELLLNQWLEELNISLIGKIPAPTGLNSLAKEYFKERWKGSSNLLLRTFWETKDDLILPTTAFFVAGEDIIVKTPPNAKVVKLGDEKYYLRVDDVEENNIRLPNSKDEEIFIQRPYESWGIRESVPFIIKRGIYRNAKFLQLLLSKSEIFIGKALEYLLLIKKGTERLFIDGQVTYDENDLQKVNQDLQEILDKKRSGNGFPSYVTNFDTEITHLIPDYKKAVDDAIYAPSEKRIMAGLGLVEIVAEVGTASREGILNPKPFISEINSGIKDFKSFLKDIILIVIQKNKASHPKWMNANIEVTNSPITSFVDDKFRTFLRSMYDRGSLSKRTMVEVGGNLDFDLEIDRRKKEKEDGLEELMFAPVIQNQGLPGLGSPTKPDKKIPISKQGPEKKNFNQSWEEAKNSPNEFGMTCLKCNYEGDLMEFIETLTHSETYGKTVSICPGCSEELREEDVTFAQIIYEEAPYKTNKDLPPQLKSLPTAAKNLWRRTFNQVFKDTNDEETSRQAAWHNVETKYKKVNEKWIKK